MYQLVLHKLLIYKGFLDFKKEKTAEGLPLPLIVLPIKRPVLQRFRAGDLPALGLGLRLRFDNIAGAVLLDVNDLYPKRVGGAADFEVEM